MNRQIVRLTYVALALVAALVVMTTYWQTWASAGLAARQDNAIRRVHEFSIDRGLIFSFTPRKRLARNRERVVGEKTLFFRRYPYGPLAAHVVGYSTVGRSRTGLERSLNDYLTASNGNLSTLVDKALDELHGRPVQGNNVVTTLDLDAQQLANEQLGTNCGAVVALDPRTGKVLVMASSPGFDPNDVENHYGSIASITANCTPAAPLLNRASAGLFIPGSTFKVITASAALESKKFGPGSRFYDPGYCTVYGKQVHNFADQDGPEVFGTINLVDGPRALRQLGVLQHRPEARRQGDPRHGEALRLLRAPAARDSRGRAPPEWALSQRQALLPAASMRTSTPGAWRSARSGCS